VLVSTYVHFPWCLQKCPYCDFASHAVRRGDVPHDAYADAVQRELAWRVESQGAGLGDATLASVYFGGGTPSMWSGRALGRVLAAIRGAFAREVDALEITVECNPTSLELDKAQALRDAGVNRVSIGVQSLDDDALRYLGRLHDAAQALAALATAREVFDDVNTDLMFGVPGLQPHALIEHAQRLIDGGATHLSAYALTIETNTKFGDLHAQGKLPLAPDEGFAACYLQLEAHLQQRGFEHYEVSNYALPGRRSEHNLHYWQGGGYLGLGTGAVGCLAQGHARARRYRNDPTPQGYLAAQGAAVEVFEEELNASDIVRERLMLGLRTSDGIDLDAAQRAVDIDPLHDRAAAVERAIAQGNLVREANHLRVPHERWLHLDGIVASLF
jgi:oxygen-independent coproporphyrinogen-3 oxidase